jgi:predicted GIY-YIG superfamily endonuclease
MSYGIYKLSFKQTSKVYIGRSEDIENRYKQHLSVLKSKNVKHYNKALQLAYDKYGDPKLDILECLQVNSEALAAREVFYILKYNSVANGFNVSYGETKILEELPKDKYANDMIRIAFKLIIAKTIDSEICCQTGITDKMINAIKQGTNFTWLQVEFPVEYAQLMRSRSTKYSKGNYNEVEYARKNW